MPEEKQQTIGDRIKLIRGEMTQKDFADLLGMGRTALFYYEKDKRMPDAEFLLKLHVLYKVQPLWLLTGMGQDMAGEKLSPRERALLENYRACDEGDRKAIEKLALRCAQAHRK